MDAAEREAFLGAARNAVLATVGPDGRTHAVPVWFRYVDGVFRIITERGSAKHRNAARVGRASLCIPDDWLRYVSAEGPVAVEDPVSYEERLALHSAYRGAEAAREIVERGGHERMVILALRPERWFNRS